MKSSSRKSATGRPAPMMADLRLTSVQDMFARNNVSGTLPPRQIMLRGYEILLFEGAPQRLPAVPSGCTTQPLDKTLTSELDPDAWGARRKVDDDLRSDMFGFRGRQVLPNEQPIGSECCLQIQPGSDQLRPFPDNLDLRP